jgi:hypothetical protein
LTATNEKLQIPVPLRAYLEAGCDPAAVGLPAFRRFQDDLATLLAGSLDAEALLRRAQQCRWSAQDIVAGGDGGFPGGRERLERDGGLKLQQFLTAEVWEADLYEDPTLADLLRGFMTEEENAKLDWMIAATKAPHPLVVGRHLDDRGGRCQGCGSDCSDLALTVGDVEGWSSAPGEGGGPWCFACVTIAYEAMKAAQS